jgi:NAD(P)-dependent dehydrogenase (short-subunit alcohol dehydrogenase family)
MHKQVCVVVGVGPGIGMAVARRFAKNGFDIGLVAPNEAALNLFARDLAPCGTKVRAYPANVSVTDSIMRAFESIKADFGHVDLLAYNAARIARAPAVVSLPFPMFPGYGATKAALRNLALNMAQELKPYNIHAAIVTVTGFVQPGTTYPDVIAEQYW